MPRASEENIIRDQIHQLAAAAGVLTQWVDVWGNPKDVTDEHLLATLSALTGRDLETADQIDGLAHELQHDRPLVEPVVVAWRGRFPETPTSQPVTTAYLVTEQGDEHRVSITENSLTIAEDLPLGYHELHVAGTKQPTLVISAPLRAPAAPERALGILAPVYAMRCSDGDTGIGNFSHLEQLADTGMITGASVIGTLPLVATFPDQPSPYSPASRRAWNELLIDLAAAPAWEGTVPSFTGDPLWVDYDSAGPPIRNALAAYAEDILDHPQLQERIDTYALANPEIARYARFRATCDRYGRNWRAWPKDSVGHPNRVNYHLTAQWLAAEQLQDLGDRLATIGHL